MKIRLYTFFMIFMLFISVSISADTQKTKILVAPFKIQAQQDYPFLQKGISQMLLSRLEIPSISTAIPQNNIKLENIESKKFDFLLSGNILIFDDSTSTDAKLIDVKTGKTVLVFNEFGKTRGDILSHVNLLAQKIRIDILHIQPTKQSIISDSKETINQKKYTYIQKPKKQSLWKSRKFNEKFISLSIGDINGDLKNETVVCTENKIYIYKYNKKRLEKISEFKLGLNTRIISVDVGDINKNKKSEIYVTAIDKRSKLPSSFVLELNGTKFNKILDNQKLLFRIINTKNKGLMLLGQALGKGEKILKTPVLQLLWNKQKLSSTRLNIPENICLYSFTFGDAINNGLDIIAAITPKGKIQIFSNTKERLWASTDNFGGTSSYLEYKGMRYTQGDGYRMSKHFLQQRILISDLDSNGKKSIVIVKNNDSASNLLSKTRIFKKGYIEFLTWDDIGFISDGRTRTFAGYISDYAIADQNNDGEKELVFCVFKSEKIINQKHTTILYSQKRPPHNL